MKRKEQETLVNNPAVPHAQETDKAAPSKKRWLWRVLVSLLACLLSFVVTVAVLWDPVFKGLFLFVPAVVVENTVQQETTADPDALQLNLDLPPEQEVRNIALFGIDQEEGSAGRSDAMMILSVDQVNNKIKMTTLDRDSLVAIDGHGEEKLTHAWAYGKGELALKTLNQNFGMNITDYAYVNYSDFVEAIDYIGGIYVDVSAEELEYLNSCRIDWIAAYGADWDTPEVPGTGRQRLNGAQALTYARNRSDGTTKRGGRQREVLLAMYDRVREMPAPIWPLVAAKMLSLCHTTMEGQEMVSVAYWALTSAPRFESLSLPNSQLKPWGGILDDRRGWVRVYDRKAAAEVLHRFIYETEGTVAGVTQYQPTTDEKNAKTTTATGTAGQ